MTPAVQKTIKPVLAGVFFLLAMLKNLILIVAAGMVAGMGANLTATSLGMMITVMPIVGLVGCLGAMVLCFMRKMWMITLVLGVVAMAGSSLFGIMIWIAPISLVLTLLGVVMIVLSKNEFQG